MVTVIADAGDMVHDESCHDDDDDDDDDDGGGEGQDYDAIGEGPRALNSCISPRPSAVHLWPRRISPSLEP